MPAAEYNAVFRLPAGTPFGALGNFSAFFLRQTCHYRQPQFAVCGATELVEQAARGHEAIAISDNGNVQAFPGFFEAAKKRGIEPIFGITGCFINDSSSDVNFKKVDLSNFYSRQKPNRIEKSLQASDFIAFGNFLPKAANYISALQIHREGLLIGSGSELFRAIWYGKSKDVIDKISENTIILKFSPPKTMRETRIAEQFPREQ